MSETKVLEPTPAELLRLNHRWIRELFRLLASAPATGFARRETLFHILRRELGAHIRITRRDLNRFLGNDFFPPGNLAILEDLLEKVADLSPEHPACPALVKALERQFEIQASIEERIYFPVIEHLPGSRQNDLVLRLIRMKEDVGI